MNYLLDYILALNIITFFAFGIDKYKATHHRSRIPNATLLGLSLLGGSIGGLFGMYLFRHKTKKKYYTLTVPVFLVVQVVVVLLYVSY